MVKDPYAVLLQKENDLARVRKEVEALLAIIPLISDDPPEDIDRSSPSDSIRKPQESADNGMTELKRYFPFIKHLRS